MKLINLDEVLLIPEVIAIWKKMCSHIVADMILAGNPLDPKQAPEEQARVEVDGSLTIFVVIPQVGELALRVPPGHWAWRQ